MIEGLRIGRIAAGGLIGVIGVLGIAPGWARGDDGAAKVAATAPDTEVAELAPAAIDYEAVLRERLTRGLSEEQIAQCEAAVRELEEIYAEMGVIDDEIALEALEWPERHDEPDEKVRARPESAIRKYVDQWPASAFVERIKREVIARYQAVGLLARLDTAISAPRHPSWIFLNPNPGGELRGVGPMLGMTRSLQLVAWGACDAGDTSRAVQALERLFRHARFLTSGAQTHVPIVMGHAVHSSALQVIRQGVMGRTLDAQGLGELGRLLEANPWKNEPDRGLEVWRLESQTTLVAYGRSTLHTPEGLLAVFSGVGAELHRRIDRYHEESLKLVPLTQSERIARVGDAEAFEQRVFAGITWPSFWIRPTPALHLLRAFDMAECDSSGVRLLVAVEQYRLVEGSPPLTLQALVPEYIAALPRDPFAPGGATFRYELLDPKGATLERSYRLYSVGADGEDNKGAPADPPHMALSSDRGTDYVINRRD